MSSDSMAQCHPPERLARRDLVRWHDLHAACVNIAMTYHAFQFNDTLLCGWILCNDLCNMLPFEADQVGASQQRDQSRALMHRFS